MAKFRIFAVPTIDVEAGSPEELEKKARGLLISIMKDSNGRLGLYGLTGLNPLAIEPRKSANSQPVDWYILRVQELDEEGEPPRAANPLEN